MKTYLIWLPASLTVIMAAFVSPVQRVFSGRKTVSQTVEFAVYKGNEYSANAYDYTSAQVHIVIEKVSAKERVGIWDTTIAAREIRDFPGIQQATTEKITVRGLIEKKEHLEVTYILTYDSKGSQLQMQGSSVNNGTGKTDIKI